jgi:hypothetical protein
MSEPVPVTIVDVGYRSSHYWVVSAGISRLLVDLGWPGTMGRMRANLRRMDVPLDEIRYGLATHYHIDHAGLAQELKLAGVPLLVPDVQVSAIPIMKRWTKPRDNYVEITTHDNVVISTTESRAVLARIGIPGEIVHTPGLGFHRRPHAPGACRRKGRGRRVRELANPAGARCDARLSRARSRAADGGSACRLSQRSAAQPRSICGNNPRDQNVLGSREKGCA